MVILKFMRTESFAENDILNQTRQPVPSWKSPFSSPDQKLVRQIKDRPKA